MPSPCSGEKESSIIAKKKGSDALVIGGTERERRGFAKRAVPGKHGDGRLSYTGFNISEKTINAERKKQPKLPQSRGTTIGLLLQKGKRVRRRKRSYLPGGILHNGHLGEHSTSQRYKKR